MIDYSQSKPATAEQAGQILALLQTTAAEVRELRDAHRRQQRAAAVGFVVAVVMVVAAVVWNLVK
jgi:Type VII secretion system ESX-1, transport TM domain B